MNPCFIKFEHTRMQAELVKNLKLSRIPFKKERKRGVTFAAHESTTVRNIALHIRDSQFRWYLLKYDDPASIKRFQRLLKGEKLKFIVEHTEVGTWFVVPKTDKMKHEKLFVKLAG
jgi:hypothetical protein